LTKYEYEEFGDPAHRVEDFEMLLRLSPIEALGSAGAPGVFVLCRTGEKDKNVFAYESVKWVDALRGQGGQAKGGRSQEKLVAIGKGQAHFSHGGAVTFERTEDYLVLCEKILKKN
jgi:protease II